MGLQRVNVTLAVMSRCPDALACEAAFDKVLDRVNAKTRVTMSYIGSIDQDKKNSKYGVSCMHGDQECAGNIQQLCVQDALDPVRAGEDFDLSPSAAQKKWWNFLQCQNYAGLSKIGDEGLAQRCLRVVDGPSWDKDGIAKCAHGKQGKKLLQHSVKASKKADLAKSCTIVFENGKRCIRDGGAWKDCDLGHQPADFVAEIERIWSQKNEVAINEHAPRSSKTLPLSPTRLSKRQTSSSSPTNTDSGFSNPFAGSSTPPSVFGCFLRLVPLPGRKRAVRNLILVRSTPIALFVIVVCFVLLRIIMRNRRLRRLGLLPDGPFDRLLGPTREIEDTLTPPKLLEARIAHDFRPAAYDAEVKAKGWDAVMPISAAVPPVLYSDLFPKSKTSGTGSSSGAVADPVGTNAGAQDDFSYPPSSSPTGGLTRRLHVPSFLRRHGDSSSHDDANGTARNAFTAEASYNGTDADAKNAKADTSTPASVNITVLIAMPSQRTVFPSTQSQFDQAAIKSQRSLNFTSTDKIDEVEESVSGHQGGLRRTASIKSFRTAASAKSIGDARREAFFNKMNEQEGNTVSQDVPATNLDDEDEEELPELVFGTASVPIFARLAGAGAAGREPFAGTLEAYQPLRSELVRLVTSAHEARERKVAMEAAAKQAEKDAANADDGQTTIDERSTTNNQGRVGATADSGVAASAGHRVSASETIDSETAAIIGSPGLATVPTAAHQDGLGDVVSRMMAEPSQHGTSTSSPVPAPAIGGHLDHRFSEDPRPSIGVNSNLSRDETSTPVAGEAHAGAYNTSTLTLDPLLGDSAGSYTGAPARHAHGAERTA
ncbi:hypothetical protein PHSY_004960 [Pseudozyma hubeiensis SY62]|uniref:Uncharacterized protein n=1 Tax=Pseudozyma hubeiensis (strain SY62) TaxID=1305764 RepID=R9PH23_PSEHS|nr:hypothetical protein PHSY_004960 [Pseudozyma hubeiensis SY62]GAC97375.1 hypothetical protein PHSY_004960 [Pseudozyma hubeiensis SY62]